MRDKTHIEQVERWAEFVKKSPISEWKPAVNRLINAQFQKANEFNNRLKETEKGREILKRLRDEKVNH